MTETRMILVDELATFMNDGWPGVDWYLSEHAEYLWETTFTTGKGRELYRACRPGTMVNLYDFEATLRWQGTRRDPTKGNGQKLSVLFLDWQRTRSEAVVVAYVPRAKLSDVSALLTGAGCLLVTTD